ncbi:transporter [Solimicrobium silvestre]|uniref:Putative MetA-pathway of phenol degradation n=1 Tax=Solimicrobium silvestre TaxID=2099400 RepID=A0A2S9GU20_9BURK|nr:transporter [Solimicrobium silvestre]PRC91235.1 putative MetA-pathway of phenol degradation [Solimicrobium silvestre]
MKISNYTILLLSLVVLLTPAFANAACPNPDDPIATDRSSVANSSSVLPAASIQFENGISNTRDQGITTYDLTETRVRIGLGGCTEFLVDLPNYTHAEVSNGGVSGFSNLGPAVKHQFPEFISGLILSATLGVYLNTGDSTIAGAGPAPYAQLPWSVDLGSNWSINGMLSATSHRHDVNNNAAYQTSVYLDRIINDNADMFVEYINDYQLAAMTVNRVDIGGSYRLTPHQQLDAKVGAGLNSAAPSWYFTVGYSFRFDHLF